MKIRILLLPFLTITLVGLILSNSPISYAGDIKGKVYVEKTPRHVAARYPGSSGSKRMQLEDIPAVVFIKGKIPDINIPLPAENPLIEQKDLQFNPPLLIIPAGTTVSFPNRDKEFHNVFSYSKNKRFDLGRYPKGETKSVTFDKIGIVKIYCEIHEWMRAVVIVVENPYYTVVSKEGDFVINNVPAGKHTVSIWSIDHGYSEINVEVQEKETREIEVQLSRNAKPAVKTRTIYVQQIASVK